jgi:hypothetical protein
MAKLGFECPMCNGAIDAALDMAGEAMVCPHCGKQVRIPSPQGGQGAPVVPAVTRTIVSSAPTSGFAVWCFVLALISVFCLGFLTGIPAIICGHTALGRIKNSQGALGGQGLAITGLIIAYFSVACWVLWLMFFGGLAFLGSLASMSQ